MQIEIQAEIVNIDTTDEGIMVIGFADAESDGNYVIIQHQSELPQNEREMGWTKYYLELSYTDSGDYNCIASVSASRNLIEIKLNSRGEMYFGTGSVLINIKLQNNLWNDLRNALKCVFEEELGVNLVVSSEE